MNGQVNMNQNVSIKKNLYQQYTDIMPRGVGALFFMQMFSTLAFSILYSTLVLYLTNRFHLNDITATHVTASFVAFYYALHLLGGYVGGRFFSYRSLFAIGMILQICGCMVLATPSIASLFWGLAIFAIGAGFNLTCINCMVTQLFKPDDHRREGIFLWNYSGMNVGFFVGFSLSGYFKLYDSYHSLFILASSGSFISLILTAVMWKALHDTNTTVMQLTRSRKIMAHIKGAFFILTLILGLHLLLKNAHITNAVIMLMGMGMALVIAYLACRQATQEARNKMWAYLILAMATLVFWTLYQLAPMGLTLFVDRNVDLHFFGYTLAPQWVFNINTIMIILGGPLLSMAFNAMRQRGIQLVIPLQFSIALILIGISLLILPIGIYFANAQGYVNFNWILASYIIQSIGELFISPIGFAMVGQLAPAHLQGLMMGTWLMIIGIAAALSGYFSNRALGATHSTDPLLTNAGFSKTFEMLGWAAIVTGILLWVLVPFILRLTQEKKLFTQ